MKIMIIKKLFLIFFLLSAVNNLNAQENTENSWQQRKQQFKAEKIAYISTELGLTVEEAQKFWPVYNKYDGKLDSLGEARRKLFNPKSTDIHSLKNCQCKTIMDKWFELDKEELAAKNAFYNELQKLFPASKIMQYYCLEHEFRRKIVAEKQKVNGSFGKSYKNE